jgi:hypothetical protein
MSGEQSDRIEGTEPLPAGSSLDSVACVRCSTPLWSGDRFCESCGTDQAVSPRWSIEIVADRTWFDRLGNPGVQFPDGRPVTRLELAVDQVTIGRASAAHGSNPDIDLSAGLADPGVSHRHAIIRRLDATRFEVVDLGSTNGTTINDSCESLLPHTPTPVEVGDRIRLGAWSTIVVRPPSLSAAW